MRSSAYIAIITLALSAQSAFAGCNDCGPRKHAEKEATPACCVAAKKADTECKVCAAKKAKKAACCVTAAKAGTECKACAAKAK